jgi:hypothetical protein
VDLKVVLSISRIEFISLEVEFTQSVILKVISSCF